MIDQDFELPIGEQVAIPEASPESAPTPTPPPQVVIQYCDRSLSSVLAPPLVVLVLAGGIILVRALTPDWQGYSALRRVQNLKAAQTVATQAGPEAPPAPPTPVILLTRAEKTPEPKGAASAETPPTPQPNQTPEPDDHVIPATAEGPGATPDDSATTAPPAKPKLFDPPAAPAVPPEPAQPDQKQITAMAWDAIRQEAAWQQAHRDWMERNKLPLAAQASREARQRAQAALDEARDWNNRARGSFRAELARLVSQGKARSRGDKELFIQWIEQLCQDFTQKIVPAMEDQVHNFLANKAMGMPRVQRVQWLRRLGWPEPLILDQIWTEEKGRILARNGPRDEAEAAYIAAVQLLNIPVNEPNATPRPRRTPVSHASTSPRPTLARRPTAP
jgi:hypothetical protein